MKCLDLFSGTQSIAREFRTKGHRTYTIELDKSHEGIDWYEDILKTKKLREQTIPLAEFNNRVLWQEIQENYPVIPSSEQLRKEYEELCQTVDSTVQKYSPLNEEPPEP